LLYSAFPWCLSRCAFNTWSNTISLPSSSRARSDQSDGGGGEEEGGGSEKSALGAVTTLSEQIDGTFALFLSNQGRSFLCFAPTFQPRSFFLSLVHVFFKTFRRSVV
jgi:hypothetical protein